MKNSLLIAADDRSVNFKLILHCSSWHSKCDIINNCSFIKLIFDKLLFFSNFAVLSLKFSYKNISVFL